MIVRELITKLGFSVNQAQFNNAERGFNTMRTKGEQLVSIFRNVAGALVGVASAKAIVDIGDTMQGIRTRIGQLPQTIDDAGVAFDVVASRATAAGMSIDAYSKTYTRVGNAAKDYIKTQEDLLGITDTISKALTVGGASAHESSAVMTQFSQALGSGVLQGDEFRSMAEAAPQYLDKLAETMKIPREQLKKMASDGKLTTKAVIEATRQMSDYFDTKFKEIPMTVGRASTIVANRFATMVDRMNRDSNFIGKIAGLMLSAFDKIEGGLSKLVEAFGGWGNMLRFIGITIGVAFGAKALQILAAFRLASLAALLPFIKIAAIIGIVSLLIEDLYVWINGGDSIVGALIGPWETWRPYVMGAISMVVDAFTWLISVVGSFYKVLKGAFTLDAALFKEGAAEYVGAWWAAIKTVVGYLWQSFIAVNNLIIESLINLVGWLLTSIYEGVASALAAIKNAFIETMGAIGELIYMAVFNPIVSAFKAAWDVVKSIFPNFGGIVEGAVSSTKSAISSQIAPSMSPSQLTSGGKSAPIVNNATTVNVTVPQGTTAEQAAYLQSAAKQSFNKSLDDKFARDMAVYAP